MTNNQSQETLSWHHIDNDLPPEGKTVIAYCQREGSVYTATLGYTGETKIWISNKDQQQVDAITHWMNIPPPPL